ncbi:MAG: glycosyltransferase family 9 protein [Desulfovibrionaceae bacterium]
MNIIVINLTRFGDLLQTQPLIHALTTQGHKVGLVCLKNFAPAAALLDGVDYVAALPGALVLAEMDSDWRTALMRVQAFVDDVQQHFPVQGIVNTTATLSARLLARSLTIGGQADISVQGFALDEDGFGCNGNVWATFLQGSTMRRLNSPFNIVDMFRMAGGCAAGPAVNRLRSPLATVRQAARRLLDRKTASALQGQACTGYVSFQLGASEARRQWPVEYFARLGEALWSEFGLCPLLLGAPAERPLAEAYAALTRTPHVDAVGETDIPHLAALLQYSRLLVTNDTGTMHLAAGLDIPVLAIFLATAQAWDTGPYREHCCCLEPALPCHPCAFDSTCPHDAACLRAISPETVWARIRGFMHTGQWGSGASEDLPGSRVWLTETDVHGFAHLRCLSSHGDEDRSLWLELQRHFYRHIIDSLDCRRDCPPVTDFPLPPAHLGQHLSAPFRESVHTVLRQAEDLLHLLTEQGIMAQQVPGPLPGQRFLSTCNRVRSLFEQSAPLCALGHLWTVILQERGDDLQAIIRMALILQKSLGQWRAYLEIDM